MEEGWRRTNPTNSLAMIEELIIRGSKLNTSFNTRNRADKDCGGSRPRKHRGDGEGAGAREAEREKERGHAWTFIYLLLREGGQGEVVEVGM